MPKSANFEANRRVHVTKKCWKCHTYLPVVLEKCSHCGVKVGKPDEHGHAIRPVNWLGYVVAVLAWVAFGLFFWWAFLRDTP